MRSVPPIRPSTVLPGLIQRAQRRLADRRTDEQGADVVGDDAEDDEEQRVGADVVAADVFDQRRISAAYEPSSPIHTTPIVVTAMFGSGPDSTPAAPMNPMAPAMNANAMTSGSPPSPTQ